MDFVSRAGQKLHHALLTFGVSPEGKTCADLGANAGGPDGASVICPQGLRRGVPLGTIEEERPWYPTGSHL